MSELEELGKRLANRLPAPLSRAFKRVAVYPRFWLQQSAAARAYAAHGSHYQYPTLFIAGLPKSGTTWLELMVSSYPGYSLVAIPEPSLREYATGGTHDFDLPADTFKRFENKLVLSKLHVHGSGHNVGLLLAHEVPVVVLFRDLRDVAVSYCHYVARTAWHPQHGDYVDLSLEEALTLFGETLLIDYVRWVESWEQYAGQSWLLSLRYEQLLEDAKSALTRVAEHFGLPAESERIEAIVAENDFSRLRERQDSQPNGQGFFRSGRAGDWR